MKTNPIKIKTNPIEIVDENNKQFSNEFLSNETGKPQQRLIKANNGNRK